MKTTNTRLAQGLLILSLCLVAFIAAPTKKKEGKH